MRNPKRKASVLLSVLLSMILTTACSGNAGKTGPNNDNATAQPKTAGGKLVVYGWSGDWDLWFQEWGARFKQETGIEVQYVSGGGLEMLSRVIAEKDSPRADLLLSSGSYLYQLDNMGLLSPIPWDQVQNAADVDDRFKTESVAVFGYDVYHLAYNPNHVSDSEVPASWADLTKPEWKGRIIQRDPGSDLTAWVWMALADQYGEEKATETIVKMFENATSYASSVGTVVQELASGEVDVAPASIGHIMLAVQQAGGNVRSGMPDRPILMYNGLGIIKNGPNQEAAVKFIDFFLGTYIQDFIMNKAGTSVAVNSKVKLTNTDLVDIGLGGISLDEVLAMAYTPDFAYWSETVDGDQTRLSALCAKLAEAIKQ